MVSMRRQTATRSVAMTCWIVVPFAFYTVMDIIQDWTGRYQKVFSHQPIAGWLGTITTLLFCWPHEANERKPGVLNT